MMEEDDLRIIEKGSDTDVLEVIKKFNKKNAKTFSFAELSQSVKSLLVEALRAKLQQCPSGSHSLRAACLEMVRILSRDKNGLDALITDAVLAMLITQARLKPLSEEDEQRGNPEIWVIGEGETKVIVEAQKCLCNVLFNSTFAQRTCSSNGCIEGIVQRLKTYQDPNLSHEIKFYDMRILFLLTALVADIRPHLRHDLHGITYLNEVLDLCLREAEEQNRTLNMQEIDLACEILKILFNLTVSIDKNNLDEEEEAHFLRLVSVLHDLLICKVICKDKSDELHSHIVNLLANMPSVSYEELLTPMTTELGTVENKEVEFDGKNMNAIAVLLEFLSTRLDRKDKDKDKSQMEALSPVLHCFGEICRANRDIRKFCRKKILPYLRSEVKRLPEEGTTLRNRMCKLLTDPVTAIHDLAADLLFVLCKENEERFTKYTGFGNAAGLLAQRGLLGSRRQRENIYSSDSEDSDTEEYNELKSKINRVTGRYEEDKPDPMAGMTEEQKEEEAMKFLNNVDKLHRQGIIQPVRVGPDGKPQPVDHILELAEGLQGEPSGASTSDDN